MLVDLPKDVTTAICPDEVDDKPREHVVGRKNLAATNPAHARQAAEAAAMINRSERPVLYVGGGAIIARADVVLRKVAEAAEYPRDHHAARPGRFR